MLQPIMKPMDLASRKTGKLAIIFLLQCVRLRRFLLLSVVSYALGTTWTCCFLERVVTLLESVGWLQGGYESLADTSYRWVENATGSANRLHSYKHELASVRA